MSASTDTEPMLAADGTPLKQEFGTGAAAPKDPGAALLIAPLLAFMSSSPLFCPS